MEALRRIRGRSVAGVAVAAVVATAFGGTAHASSGSSYLGVLNQERASRGLAPLHMSSDLVRVAQSWTDTMASSGSLRHNPQLRSAVSDWWAVGENVGYGGDLADLERAFWNSPEHRANILDPQYTDVGIALTRRDGRLWITVDFRQPLHQATSARQQQRAPETTVRTYPGRLLMRGSTGPTVAFVQRLLGLRPSGVFGALTQRAVLTFQRRNHLVADAIVGPITWSALFGTGA
jgi:peptidoglycan hydrolase-like protein with peptidoglycan-binding domain